MLRVVCLGGIEGVGAEEWNGLLEGGDGGDGVGYPFLRYEFLAAMERFGCVGVERGWVPRHLGCFDGGGRLVGAMPLYEKHNSWGEFVFDHAWAEAFARTGLKYYPKLVNAIPYTPATGRRVLVADGADGAKGVEREEVYAALLGGARGLCGAGGFSGVHSLFLEEEEAGVLVGVSKSKEGGVAPMMRVDCQFHWHNRGYRDFEDFLAGLKAKKRKNIRRERAGVQAMVEGGLRIVRLDGGEARMEDWQDFARVYARIYERKYGFPAFNAEFFAAVAEAMPEQIHLVLARRGEGTAVAGALLYSDGETLYGRHWGCEEVVEFLHFELCYYQGIEICLERGLKRFDPGAQGEHKVARGFVAVETRSLHWMAESPFSEAIREFVKREGEHIGRYMEAVGGHSPYREGGEGG